MAIQGNVGYRASFEGRPTPFKKWFGRRSRTDVESWKYDDADGKAIDAAMYARWEAAGGQAMGPAGGDSQAFAEDKQVLREEVLSRATERLKQLLGPQAGEQAANAIANAAVQHYEAHVNAGKNPGQARAEANQIADKAIADEYIKANQPNPDLQPRVPTPEELAAQRDKERVETATGNLDKINNKAIDDYLNQPGLTNPNPMDLVSGASPSLTATMQRGTTVGPNAYAADLEATARGQGAGQIADQARRQAFLQQAAQRASGLIAQSRGSERRGMRRASLLQMGENIAQQDQQMAAQSATERMGAQTQLANIDQQRTALQAQLDSARAQNDQAAINEFTKKIADLDMEKRRLNLDAQNQQERQRVENERLGIDKGKAAGDAARSVTQESQRKADLEMSRQKLDLAEREFEEARRQYEQNRNDRLAQQRYENAMREREYWSRVVTGLISGAASVGASMVGAPKAARGGLVEGPRTIVGEGEHRELVIPIKGKLSAHLEKALAIDSTPFMEPVPVDRLMGAIKRHIGAERPPARRSGAAELLADYNVRSRKGAQ